MIIWLVACTTDPTMVVERHPGQGLDYRFDATGVVVDHETWSVELRPLDVGRPGERTSIVSVPPVSDGGLVRYESKRVDTWYLREPRGLEQGFVIHERPNGDGPAEVRMHVDSTLEPVFREGGVDFMDGTSVLARYDALFVRDAEGRDLAAEMHLDCAEGCVLTLAFDDEGASYPVEVDPLLFGTATTLPVDHGSSTFGVAFDGSEALAFGGGDVVLHEDPGTGWQHVTSFTPSSGLTGEIDLSADRAVVAGTSVVEVFTRQGGVFVQTQTLTPGFAGASPLSVSLDGDLLAVGEDSGFTLYHHDGTSFLPVQTVFTGGFLMHEVDLDGSTLAVHELAGATIAFYDVSPTTVTLATTLFHNGFYGERSMALHGDTALLGSEWFQRTGGVWSAGGFLPYAFGFDDQVSVRGDRVVFSAPASNTLTLFERDATGWTQRDQRVGANGLGRRIDLQGDRVLAGDDNGQAHVIEVACPTEIVGNGIDEDCDGFDAPCHPGSCGTDLVIEELLVSPISAATMADGVWIEVAYNGTDPVDLLGLDVVVEGNTYTVSQHTVVFPGGRAVLGASADRATNGDVPVDAVLPGLALPRPQFVGPLAEVDVSLRSGNSVLDHIGYGLSHSTGRQFPFVWNTGASLSLDPVASNATDNDVAENWCDGLSTFGDGDFGTPGLANDSCTFTLTIDVDYVMQTPPDIDIDGLTVTFGRDRRFSTSNSGAGTYERSTDFAGQSLVWTYDSTDVRFSTVSNPRPLGSDCWTNGAIQFPQPAPYFGALSGSWSGMPCL